MQEEERDKYRRDVQVKMQINENKKKQMIE